ncbi:dienelactone hydrolase family protein [Microbacterium sp.]|uniref:dienelactone hydrolase family protein n=1 Tax=Microbacterium sp. TaxID=51671 RepID=UPI003A862FFD
MTRTTNITITTDDGVAEALLIAPDEPGEYPGVVYYPDAMGVRPAFEDMAERVANWGYVVLMPNYFYRSGTIEQMIPKIDLSTPEGWARIGEVGLAERVGSVDRADAVADAGYFVDALRGADGVAEGAVATAGYCFGGLQALRAAESRPEVVSAVGAFHTGGLVQDTPDSVHRHFADTRAEYYLGHADADPTATPENIATVETALADAGRTYTSELYENAGHGFTVPDLAPYRRNVAEQHYDRLRELLGRALAQ